MVVLIADFHLPTADWFFKTENREETSPLADPANKQQKE